MGTLVDPATDAQKAVLHRLEDLIREHHAISLHPVLIGGGVRVEHVVGALPAFVAGYLYGTKGLEVAHCTYVKGGVVVWTAEFDTDETAINLGVVADALGSGA